MFFRVVQTFEEYLVTHVATFLHKRDSLLKTAIHCQMVRLQGACLTEFLLEIIRLARQTIKPQLVIGDPYTSIGPASLSGKIETLRTALAPKFDELFSYDLHPEVRKRLNKAVAELFYYAMTGPVENPLSGLERKQIEDIMISKGFQGLKVV